MKRVFLICLTILLCFLTSSCSENKYEPYIPYEIGPYDCVSGVKHNIEINDKRESYEGIKLIKTKRVKIFGEKYKVTYQETIKYCDYSGKITETEVYEYSGDSYDISVHFNKKTGKLTAWHKYEKNYENNGEIKDEEACLQIACDYLSDYVDDIDKYEVVFKNSTSTASSFTFYRFIDGMKTCDIASIRVRNNGDVCSVDIEYAGRMKDAEVPDESILIKIRSNVDAKLDKMYEDVRDDYTVIYDDKEEMLLKLSDGSYAIECIVSVTVIPTDSERESISETSGFIIFLD